MGERYAKGRLAQVVHRNPETKPAHRDAVKPFALIWDVDGTLADTERDGHRPAFNAAFAELGLDWHWDERLYGELLAVAGGVERMHHYATTTRPTGLSPPELEDLLSRLHARKTAFYVRSVEAGLVRLRPGVERLLDEARAAGVRMAIATTTTRANVNALLKSCLGSDAIARFDAIATASEAPAKKPDPAVYLHALRELGIEACDALAIEDSSNGLRAACAAGIACIVTRNDYTANDDFSGARAVLDDLMHTRLCDLADIAGWQAGHHEG